MNRNAWMVLLAPAAVVAAAWAGPYAGPIGTVDNPYDRGIPGWVGPAGEGVSGGGYYAVPGQVLNDAFVGWATGVVTYAPASSVDAKWADPTKALGPAVGDEYEVVSLGDLSAADIAAHLVDPDGVGVPHPGSITLAFDVTIADGPGPDLAVFENGFSRTGSPTFFAELAYVEVSTDGVTFARLPARSLMTRPDGDTWPFVSIDVTDVYNLAGKHTNAEGLCWGTPFDLADLADDPAVTAGQVDLQNVHFVRIVDIPGSGAFVDATGAPIYDGWMTTGSAGFDLDAVGVLKQNFGAGDAAWDQGDFDGDGDVDLDDFAILKQNFGT